MRISYLALALSLILSATALAQQSPKAITPNQVHWTAGTGMMAGTQVALLVGDPSKPGPYVMRLKLPDGYKFPPHFHGSTEYLTVLQGTFLVGVGDRPDPAKMIVLPAGSFGTMPASTHHYAVAKGETIIELWGNGPFTMTMVGHGSM
jgi:quercetin dioxygenase-like cupin family protein